MRKDREDLLVVGVVVGLLTVIAAFGMGAPFRDVPPTIGAYTLRGGEWQIGAVMGFASVPLEYRATSVSVAHGITGWFDVGIAVSHGAQPPFAYMTYAFSAKLRLPLGPGLDLGVPVGVGFQDRLMGIEFHYLQGGAVVSSRVGALTFHGGATVGAVKGAGWYLHPYAIADYDVLPSLKLAAELSGIPVSVAIGVCLRLLDFMDLKLAVTPPALSVTGGVNLRF